MIRIAALALTASGAVVLFAPPASAWVCDGASTGGCAGATGLSSCGGGCGTCSAISGVLCKCKSGPASCGAGTTCNPTRTCVVSSTGEGSCPSPPGSGTKCDADSNPCTDDNCNGAGGCAVGFDYTGSCSSHKGECNDIAAPWCKASGGLILCDDKLKPDGTPCSKGECQAGKCVDKPPPPPTDSGTGKDSSPPPADSSGADATDDAADDSDTKDLFPIDDGAVGGTKDGGKSGASDLEGSAPSCGCELVGGPTSDLVLLGAAGCTALLLRRRRVNR